MELRGKAVIAQGGGPTSVINASLVGAVLEAKKYPQITHLYGAINGVEGIVNENFVDLFQETTENLEAVACTPASALLSTRVKPDAEFCSKIFKVLQAHDVRYFFYIGGNDSSDTVRIVNENAIAEGYDLRAVHIPKTIDNDLVINDHTPGFGSAARYVASAFTGVNLDNRALPGVYIGVVMGRHAGFLTAAASLAKRFPDDGPHLVYVPERAFVVEKFLKDVKEVYDKYGRCVIAVSEGISDADGTPIMVKLADEVETDAHGNVQLSGSGALGDMLTGLIKEGLNISRVRADTLGYPQRNFIECISDVDQREAKQVGQKAVQYACMHGLNGSVVMERVGDYAVDFRLVELTEIAAKTKHMPDEFINEAGNNVTKAFIDYAKPLVGTGFKQGSRIMAPPVAKILNK